MQRKMRSMYHSVFPYYPFDITTTLETATLDWIMRTLADVIRVWWPAADVRRAAARVLLGVWSGLSGAAVMDQGD